MGDIGGPIDVRTTAARKFDVQPAATGPKAKIPNHDSNPSQVCTRLAAGGSRIQSCMGLFVSSSGFWFVAVLCSERERPFFVPSPAIRFAERAEGVKGPKR